MKNGWILAGIILCAVVLITACERKGSQVLDNSALRYYDDKSVDVRCYEIKNQRGISCVRVK